MSKNRLGILIDGALRSWGTLEDIDLRLAQTLINSDIQPVFVFSELPVEKFKARLEASGAIVTALNYQQGRMRYYFRLRRLIKKRRIRSVHVAHFNYFSFVPWMARLAGVRHIVFQEHNSGLLNAKSWKRTLLKLRTKVMTFPVSRFIAVSAFIKYQLEQLGIPSRKVMVVHNGIETTHFYPDSAVRKQLAATFSISEAEIILVTICRLTAFKNVDVILRACAELKRRGVGVRLLVAGIGELQNSLEKQAVELGISDDTHWLGYHREPVKLLQGCDIFLLASIGEAFGLVLPEAMACGVPVIGSRSGAIPEIVRDGVTGILVAPLDATDLANAIARLASDQVRRREMGDKGQQVVEQSFTAERCVKYVLDVYHAVWTNRAS